MKSSLKHLTMRAYCHGLISPATVLRLFSRFDLWNV